MTGRVVHFEIPFEDGDRARDFYRTVFGWEIMSMPDMGYTLVTTGPSGEQGPTDAGFINGGMMERQGPHTSPNIVIEVDDIDAALAQVGDAGGATVSERMAVGDMGFAAYFTDPEGNLMGLWQSATT